MAGYCDCLGDVSYYAGAADDKYIDLSNQVEFGSFLGRLQHHGYPTPLLDWTHSPYIAAYFAFKDTDPGDTDAVRIDIFAFTRWEKRFDQPLNLMNPKPFVSVFRPFGTQNPRMLPQRSITLMTNVADIGEHLIARGTECNEPFLHTISVPVSERQQIMRELDLMGINSMTMFPGFDGLCAAMKEQHFNDHDVNYSAKPLQATGLLSKGS